MSVRALWIVSHEKGENVSIRFSRRFSTVEHRAKCLAGSSYVAVPEDGTVLQLLLTELGLSEPDKSYVALRDDCLHRQRSPALELHVDGPGKGILWPVLAISQGPLILACLCLVDAPPEPRPPLANLLSVSQGLTLLAGLQTFLLGSGNKPDSEGPASRLAMLPTVLLQVCPLGTPLDVPALGAPATPTAPTPAGNQKQPAWKTGLYRGRAVVNVALKETVRSMQYGNQSAQDLWDVYGTVTCKCEVEGVLPNVTVTLTLPPNGSPLQDILVHPCVTSLDSSILTASSVDNSDSSAFSGPYKFTFSPPLEPFRLCSYTSQVPVPPILGSYQLKEEENQLRVSVTLKLHESVKNSFEYCEAHLPFFNRDQMGVVDVKVSSGQLDVSKEKNLLVWTLGQKFPKSREVMMEGRITFSGPTPGPTDPLCTELTAYIKLYFKVPDITLSGSCVDQHSVQVFSSAKPRIVTSRELQSKEYFIWNSAGAAPVSSGQMML
ncbi:AP-5 complex subunit mu-1 [Hippoglossus stenolepis]|uniref:AP-5 complex subunit mu-1 n=1 Tax=Hippoglossus stenolepis TaxID=195615 RepID=UPI00159C4FCC|nr:AP-5 complex subunit mu-1 [Hippoglossus stenolepis]XP_035023883.1 AP-5 complex subunit mu-1 [Hippoglossus stenolepis]